MNQQRIAGFDVARSLAIFGMMVVHFMLVMTDGMPSEKWSDTLLQILDGRPAATFVILAGMGVTLMSNKLTNPNAAGNRRKSEPFSGGAVCCCWRLAFLPHDLGGRYSSHLRRVTAAGSVVNLAQLAHSADNWAGLCSNLLPPARLIRL